MKKLDLYRNFEARKELVRWEGYIKADVERKTFRIRGKADLEEYLKEELKYNM